MSSLARPSMMRESNRAKSRRLARIDSTIGGLVGALTGHLTNMLNDLVHICPRPKYPTDSHCFERGNIFVGDDAAHQQFHVIESIGLHQVHYARGKRHVRTTENTQADHIHIFL